MSHPSQNSLPPSPGVLILVVGPSGAGKDTLINSARREFASDPTIIFPRRIVTRPAHIETEDHESATPDEFERRKQAGDFSMHWEAHGLSYGVPAAIRRDLKAGATVVVNVSRSVIDGAENVWPHVLVCLVTASPDILAARLASRGREDPADVRDRIKRSANQPLGQAAQVVEIRNDGSVTEAARAFVQAIRKARQAVNQAAREPGRESDPRDALA